MIYFKLLTHLQAQVRHITIFNEYSASLFMLTHIYVVINYSKNLYLNLRKNKHHSSDNIILLICLYVWYMFGISYRKEFYFQSRVEVTQ